MGRGSAARISVRAKVTLPQSLTVSPRFGHITANRHSSDVKQAPKMSVHAYTASIMHVVVNNNSFKIDEALQLY